MSHLKDGIPGVYFLSDAHKCQPILVTCFGLEPTNLLTQRQDIELRINSIATHNTPNIKYTCANGANNGISKIQINIYF